MSFRRAVESTAGIRTHFREGLSAVKKADRARVHCSTPRRLAGSVDLDGALARVYPNDPRWDYAIGIRGNPNSDTVLWLEVHPASCRHIDEVLRKLEWLKKWLATDAPALKRLPGHFRWVATGSVSFRRGSREERRISQRGLRFPSRRLDLDELR